MQNNFLFLLVLNSYVVSSPLATRWESRRRRALIGLIFEIPPSGLHDNVSVPSSFCALLSLNLGNELSTEVQASFCVLLS